MWLQSMDETKNSSELFPNIPHIKVFCDCLSSPVETDCFPPDPNSEDKIPDFRGNNVKERHV